MSASSPAPPAASVPSTPPVPPPPRTGAISDVGVVRRDVVRALRWDVTGTAKVLGNADVESGRSKGTVVVGGSLTAGSFDARGILDVSGSVEVGTTLTIRGTFRAGGTVRATDADLNGTVRSGGDVRVTRALRVHGSIAVPAVEAGGVTLRGQSQIPGRIVAPRVDATLEGDTALGSIEAQFVRLVRRSPNPLDRILGHTTTVTVERIEAETVELDGIEVEFVRAEAITIGRDCHVRTVEGTITRTHAGSRVGPESRSPPPPGLTR